MPSVCGLDWVQSWRWEQLRTTTLRTNAGSSLAAAYGSVPCFWHPGRTWAAVPSLACASLASPWLTEEALPDDREEAWQLDVLPRGSLGWGSSVETSLRS